MKLEPGKLIMIGLLTAFAGTSAVVNFNILKTAAPRPWNIADIIQGRTAPILEKKYRDNLFFKDAALNMFGVARYLAFGEGRKGVVIGKDGWLFSTEELQAPVDAAAILNAHLEEIQAAKTKMRAAGSELIVALIPEKADIYASELGNHKASNEGDLNYEVARKAILAQNIVAPDIRTAMISASAKSEMFLRTDTHWTPEGAMVGAAAIGTSAAKYELTPKNDFEMEAVAPIKVDGDLMRYVMLGPIRDAAGFSKETINQYILKQPQAATGDSTDLFGSEAIPVTLVGTSYSANENWDFATALKATLKTDVLNVAELGKGPFVPMSTYLASDGFRDTPPRLVIWEIPMRYLAMPSDLHSDKQSGAVISASAQ